MELKLGYKKTEVGVFPEDWEISLLGRLTTKIGSGITPTGGEKVYRSRGRPFLRSQNVGWGCLLLDDLKYIDERTHAVFPATEIKEGDVFLNITGASIGRSAVANALVSAGNVNQHVCIIRPDRSLLEPNYINSVLLADVGQRQIDSFQAGGNRQGLNFGQIATFRIPLPQIREQRAIATALSDVDALIAKLDQLIAKKRDLKQAAMHLLLTGKARLPGFSGEWEVRRLGDHVTFLRNGVNSRAELIAESPVKYIHYGDIHTSDRLLLDPATVVMPCLPEPRAHNLDRLHSGDVVFVDASEDLEGVGKSVEISCHSGDQLVAGLHTIAARFDKAILADGFKAYLQFCPEFLAQLRRLAAGTKVYATNRAHIAGIEMALPGIAEQSTIATVLSDLDAEIATLEARRDKTRAMKQGMMQVLLTGQVRLPVGTEPMEALA